MKENIKTSKSILIVTPDIHGPIRNGGIGTAFSALAKHLTLFGYRVSILYALGNHSESQSISHWINYYKMNNINFIPLTEQPDSPNIDAPNWRVISWKVDRWLRVNCNHYSIFIFPEWMGLAYYALLAKEQGLAYHNNLFIVNTHSPESWAREGNRNLPDCLDDLDRDFMERESVARSDLVVGPSKYMLNWMIKNKWRLPLKTRVIQNLMDPDDSTDIIVDKKLENADRIVFFGRLEMRKGLKLFADAMDLLSTKLKNIKEIVFLGKPAINGDFNSIDYINNRSKRWALPVKIEPKKNRDEALEFLSTPGVLCVIPSLVENSPYTVLECLEKQINFCASNVGGIPELIHQDDHPNYLFESTPSALASLIEKKINSIHKPARPSTSQKDIAIKWKNVIEELIAQTDDTFPATSNSKIKAQFKDYEPLVSVCITHYERPTLLKRAIDSIRIQTYKNIEVVLVDDGSKSDAAIQYLDDISIEFKDRKWQIIRQDNRYLGAARNNAASHAHGEYLLFMDDDNVAMPNEIETFVIAIINCGADILTCALAPFVDSQPPVHPKSIWLPLGGAAGPGLLSNAFGDANALWKSSVFHSLGGFTEDYGVGHEDWEIFANAVLSGYRLDVVPEVLFWYRTNSNGMLRSGDHWADHARSVRPYLRHNPGGLGIVAAYAVFLQQIRQTGGMQSTQPSCLAEKAVVLIDNISVKSNRPFFGWLISLCKRAIRKSTYWLYNPLFTMITQFNQAIITEIARQSNKNEEAFHQINKIIEDIDDTKNQLRDQEHRFIQQSEDTRRDGKKYESEMRRTVENITDRLSKIDEVFCRINKIIEDINDTKNQQLEDTRRDDKKHGFDLPYNQEETMIKYTLVELETDLFPGLHQQVYIRKNCGDDGILRQIFFNGELDFRKSRFWDEIRIKEEEYADNALIVDCGAHIGLASKFFGILFPHAKIVAVEPDYNNFLLCCFNNKQNTNFIAKNFAISSVQEDLFINNKDNGSAAYRVSRTSDSAHNDIVSSITINNILSEYNKLKPFIIKIDIEGWEKDLFYKNIEWVNRFDYIVIELHDWLFPGMNTSENFWKTFREHNIDIDAVGEHIIISNNGSGMISCGSIVELLEKIYSCNSKLTNWYAEMQKIPLVTKIEDLNRENQQLRLIADLTRSLINKNSLSLPSSEEK